MQREAGGEKPWTVSRTAISLDSWRMSATTVDQVRILTDKCAKNRPRDDMKLCRTVRSGSGFAGSNGLLKVSDI